MTKVLQSDQCPFKLKGLLMDQHKPKKAAVVSMTNKNVRGVARVLLLSDEAFKYDYASGHKRRVLAGV